MHFNYLLNILTGEWLITTEIGSKVSLTISDLDIEAADNCVFDYLRVSLLRI